MASAWSVMNAVSSEAINSAALMTSSVQRPSLPRIGACGDDELVLKIWPDGVTVGEPITSFASQRAHQPTWDHFRATRLEAALARGPDV